MNNWKNNAEFKAMDSRKQQMIEILFNSLQGKNISEALPIFSNWKASLASENIVFSKEENDMLTELFIQELSPEAKRQYEMIKPLIKNMSK